VKLPVPLFHDKFMLRQICMYYYDGCGFRPAVTRPHTERFVRLQVSQLPEYQKFSKSFHYPSRYNPLPQETTASTKGAMAIPQDDDTVKAPPQQQQQLPLPPRKLVSKKGIILDKDGKPFVSPPPPPPSVLPQLLKQLFRSCRTCNSLRDFMGAPAAVSASVAEPPKDCPPDVETLGHASWTLLHSIAATYPAVASPQQQKEMKTFVEIFARIYPCWVCAEDFQSWIKRPENELGKYLGGRRLFGMWMCWAHNDVNKKLGKKEFDCDKWEERWRDGWKDGTCG
jgi:FAD-linked sulfhydryl oxidase